MLDFPRWKRFAISLALALGVFLAIPSLIGETNSQRLHLTALPPISFRLYLPGGRPHPPPPHRLRPRPRRRQPHPARGRHRGRRQIAPRGDGGSGAIADAPRRPP